MATVPTYALYGEEAKEERDFWIHCETILARSSAYRFEIGLHRHDAFLQFLYIRKGSGDALLAGRTLQLQPPCVTIIPPGPVHGFRFSRDIDGLVVTVAPQRLEGSARAVLPSGMPGFEEPRLIALQPDLPETDYLERTFYRIAEEYERTLPARNTLLEVHLATIILLLARELAPHRHGEEQDPVRHRVQSFRDLLARHYRQHWSVEAYAQNLGLSATHLNRLVRQVTGQSTKDLIAERLMEEARRELVFTGYSIQQIAENLGFTDAAYFSRAFRLRTGLTPRAYREREGARLRNKEADGSV